MSVNRKKGGIFKLARGKKNTSSGIAFDIIIPLLAKGIPHKV
jgi:hypothetical protein